MRLLWRETPWTFLTLRKQANFNFISLDASKEINSRPTQNSKMGRDTKNKYTILPHKQKIYGPIFSVLHVVVHVLRAGVDEAGRRSGPHQSPSARPRSHMMFVGMSTTSMCLHVLLLDGRVSPLTAYPNKPIIIISPPPHIHSIDRSPSARR